MKVYAIRYHMPHEGGDNEYYTTDYDKAVIYMNKKSVEEDLRLFAENVYVPSDFEGPNEWRTDHYTITTIEVEE